MAEQHEGRRIEYLRLSDIVPARRNPKRHNMAALRASIARFVSPALRDERTGRLVVGNGRSEGLRDMCAEGQAPPLGVQTAADGEWLVPVVCGWSSRSDAEAQAYLVADNRHTELGGWDTEELAALLRELDDLDGTGFDDYDVSMLYDPATMPALLPGGAGADAGEAPPGPDDGQARLTLAERFGVPPFTVLDARQGYWQERKRAWLALGIDSGAGRGTALTGGFANAASRHQAYQGGNSPEPPAWAGTSIFDPVLAELLVRWYSLPGARVLDPFAGGSVRGIVAARCGRDYHGVDLRPEQVEANRTQAAVVLGDMDERVRYTVGDARDIRDLLASDDQYDMLLTCPPYFNLEVYGHDPADLSRAADYKAFLDAYGECLAATSDRVTTPAFAAVVTGAIRDPRGYILDIPADTTRIMESLGWRLYQDAVLVTQVANAAIRAARGFGLRKLTRTHQAVAVYHRGDLSVLKSWPVAEVGEISTTQLGGQEDG